MAYYCPRHPASCAERGRNLADAECTVGLENVGLHANGTSVVFRDTVGVPRYATLGPLGHWPRFANARRGPGWRGEQRRLCFDATGTQLARDAGAADAAVHACYIWTAAAFSATRCPRTMASRAGRIVGESWRVPRHRRGPCWDHRETYRAVISKRTAG
jgi:hypothetical protein